MVKKEEAVPQTVEVIPEQVKEVPVQEDLQVQLKQALEAQETYKKQAEDAKREAKAHQGVATKATQKLSQLEKQAIPAPVSGDTDRLIEILIQERKARAKELGESDPMIPVLETELAQRRQKATYEVQMRWQEQQITDAQNRCHQQLIEAGYDSEKDEIFDEVDSWISIEAGHRGEFGNVFKRLDKRIGKAKPKEDTVPKESEEERFNKLVDEGVRKKMEEKGLLETSTNLPSGASSQKELDIRTEFIEGKISRQELKRRLEGIGIQD